MTNRDKEYYIYIRSTNEKIPCTKEEFDNFYRDINAYRRTQMNRGCCVCPSSKWLWCDMDCCTCPYKRAGRFISIDTPVSNDDTKNMNITDNLEDNSPLIEDAVCEQERMKELLSKLNEMMPQAMEIGVQRLNGLSDTAISESIGVPRKTFTDRLKRVKYILQEEFPEFF